MNASSIPSPASLPLEVGEDERRETAEIKAARSGCEESFRRLVERHQHRIHRLCFHYLGNEDDALEACQDTFVRAYRALPRFQPRARFSTWLHRIALNQCYDRLRRRRAMVPLEGIDPPCRRGSPAEAAAHSADLGMLADGLAALPPRLQKVLVLTCLEGLSHAECAEILKCSERAIEGRLYRARQRLAGWWERHAG